jgi:hypothetical protein
VALSEPVAKEAAVSRLWKSKTGQFSVTATLVSFDGKSVQLKTAEGKAVTLQLDALSAEDQEFLLGQTEKKREEIGEHCWARQQWHSAPGAPRHLYHSGASLQWRQSFRREPSRSVRLEGRRMTS